MAARAEHIYQFILFDLVRDHAGSFQDVLALGGADFVDDLENFIVVQIGQKSLFQLFVLLSMFVCQCANAIGNHRFDGRRVGTCQSKIQR